MRSWSFIIGSAIAIFWLACAIAPSLFTNRTAQDTVRDSDGAGLPRVGPRFDAWFGTDTIGRDVFALVMRGAENAILPALLAAGVAVLVGTVIGVVAARSRGWLDDVMRMTLEVALSFPVVLLALFVFVVHGHSRAVLIVTIAGLSAPLVAAKVRSAMLVQVPLGAWREITASLSTFMLVEFIERVRYAVLTVSTLSFLGFGFGGGDVQQVDWGREFANAYPLISAGQWWPALFPAAALTSLVLATNLIERSVERVCTHPRLHRQQGNKMAEAPE